MLKVVLHWDLGDTSFKLSSATYKSHDKACNFENQLSSVNSN